MRLPAGRLMAWMFFGFWHGHVKEPLKSGAMNDAAELGSQSGVVTARSFRCKGTQRAGWAWQRFPFSPL